MHDHRQGFSRYVLIQHISSKLVSAGHYLVYLPVGAGVGFVEGTCVGVEVGDTEGGKVGDMVGALDGN